MQTGLTYPLIIPQPRVAFQGTLGGRWLLHNLEDSSETAEDVRAGGVPGDNLLSTSFLSEEKTVAILTGNRTHMRRRHAHGTIPCHSLINSAMPRASLVRALWVRAKQHRRAPLSSGSSLSFGRHVRNGVFPAVSLKKDATAISSSGLPNVNFWAQEEECVLCRSHQPLPTVGTEDSWDVKNTVYWPQIAEMHTKGIISASPDSCIFPFKEKCYIPWDACMRAYMLSNSLWPYGLWPTRILCPWDSPGKNKLTIIFWHSDHLPLVTNFYTSWLLPAPALHSSEHPSQSHWRMLAPKLEVLKLSTK